MITPLPGATTLVPGSCTLPFPGIMAAIVDETGEDLPNGQSGILVIKKPWPGMIRTIWGDDARYRSSYYPPSCAAATWPAMARRAIRKRATSRSAVASTTC